MKVALVVPWEETVPPAKYGGIELVVYNLAEGLMKSGHEVTLLGTADSKVNCKITPIFEQATRVLPHSKNQLAREAYTFLGVSRVVEHLRQMDVDIVHNHTGWRLLMFQKMIKQPMLTTLHLSLENKYEQAIYNLVPKHPFVSISKSQRFPLPKLNYVANIYNGIRVERFTFKKTPDDYLVFLGSFTAHKGPDKAIEVAKRAGCKLIMAGKVDPLRVRYFEKNIKPHIDGKQIQFIGEVDHAQKNQLLKNAKALLMPISWNEPFGLVMVEAMACGTPVIAIRRGSTPEIITNGRNGYLCDSVECMAECVKKVGKIKREACRKTVEKRFQAKTMCKKYERAYEKVLNRHPVYKPLSALFERVSQKMPLLQSEKK